MQTINCVWIGFEQVISRHRKCVAAWNLERFTRLLRGHSRRCRWVAISRLSAVWVQAKVFMSWTENRSRVAKKTEDATVKSCSLIYLDNVTCHGDCKCNLIVNYSSRVSECTREKWENWNARLADYYQKKQKLNAQLISPESQDDWSELRTLEKMRIIIVMNWAEQIIVICISLKSRTYSIYNFCSAFFHSFMQIMFRMWIKVQTCSSDEKFSDVERRQKKMKSKIIRVCKISCTIIGYLWNVFSQCRKEVKSIGRLIENCSWIK